MQLKQCEGAAWVTDKPGGTERALSLPPAPKGKLNRAGLPDSCWHRTSEPVAAKGHGDKMQVWEWTGF